MFLCYNTVFNLKLPKIDQICVFLKTWKKFRKPGESFQKSFGHPEYVEVGSDKNKRIATLCLHTKKGTATLISVYV